MSNTIKNISTTPMNYKTINLYNMEIYNKKRDPINNTIENMLYIVEHKPSCYHELLEGKNLIKFVIDVDQDIKKEFTPPIDEILKNLKIFLNSKEIGIKKKDIKYTKNKSRPTYHIVIPKINVLCFNLKYLILEFITIHPEYAKFIDKSLYGESKLFRLPYQSKEHKKNTEHIPVNKSSIKDFFVTIVEENSINIDNKITTPEKIKKKKQEKKEKVNNSKFEKKNDGTYEKFEKENDYVYMVDNIEIINMLNDLDDDYLNEFEPWLIITSVLKYHNLYDIWNEWSSKSEKYNEINNDLIYDYVKINIDINYIVAILNNSGKKYKLIKRFKVDNDDYEDDKKLNINNIYFDIEIKKILDYNDIIIRSDCGTGKSTFMSKYSDFIKKENPNIKVMTIISKVSLTNQHNETFLKNDINLLNYKKEKNLIGNDFTICINSLHRISSITNDELNKYIVCIDEIDDFLDNIVSNNTMNHDLKTIVSLLVRILKNCKTAIYASAHIKKNLNYILNNKRKNIFIENHYRKFKGTIAYEKNNQNEILFIMTEHIKNNSYFLLACDSLIMATKFYNEFLKIIDDKNKILLITSETHVNIENTNESFKNKFVIYSPSIIYGLDFNIATPQDVFICCRGLSITPYQMIQQVVRTRNIKSVYYYIEKVNNTVKYESMDELKNEITNQMNTNIGLLDNVVKDMCCNTNEEQELYLCNNIFFNLYIWEKYHNNIYMLDSKKKFESILLDRGFIIIKDKETEIIKLNPVLNKKLKEEININSDLLISNYIEGNLIERENPKYTNIHNRAKLLKIDKLEKNVIEEYKEIIKTEKNMTNHSNLIRLLKSDTYINLKISNFKENSMDVKIMSEVHNKISLIRKIEKENNIEKLDVNFSEEGEVVLSDSTYKLLKTVFSSKKPKPKNKHDLKKFYVSMIKHLSNDLITSKASNVIIDGHRKNITSYALNIENIKLSLKLDEYSNHERKNFNDIIKKFENITGVIK